VVVPVFNGAGCIGGCLDGLLAQSYPADRREIIVVDNGSDDGTRDVVETHPVTLLSETANRSPYAARNAGIAASCGSVIAFTDADCLPGRDWIRRGVTALVAEGADLVGGKVSFMLADDATLGELTDALWHLDVKRQIETNRACMTANLLVRRCVFETIGLFEPQIRSGGDGKWTRRATDAGFKLVYEPRSEVHKPARRLGDLLAKAYRVGRGLPAAWLERGAGRMSIAPRILRNVLPPATRRVQRRIADRDLPAADRHLLGVWWTTWLMEMVRSAGCVQGWLEGFRSSGDGSRSSGGKSSRSIEGSVRDG
jgi:glycosyltransferase involved in cell wall biosynthesis